MLYSNSKPVFSCK